MYYINYHHQQLLYLWVLLMMKKPNNFNVWIRIVSFPDANSLNTVLKQTNTIIATCTTTKPSRQAYQQNASTRDTGFI